MGPLRALAATAAPGVLGPQVENPWGTAYHLQSKTYHARSIALHVGGVHEVV